MAGTAGETDDLQKLRRFLYFGNENGLYKAGSKGYQPFSGTVSDSARIVYEMLAAEKGEEAVGEISNILTVNPLGTSRIPALFALAICARHADKSHKTKQAAMKVFATACRCTSDLFTFITFCQSLTEKKKGWGRALKSGVQRWFDSRDSMTLAKIITQQKTSCHWNYIDLLRMTHILPKTEGAKMIAKYLMKGLKVAEEEYGGEKSECDLRSTLAYLTAIEQLKGVREENVATALVEEHKLHLHQVNTHLQQIPQVLAVLAKHMSVQELLENMGRLAGRHVLEPAFPAAADIAQRIGDIQQIQDERISPIAVLIAMRVYETGSAALKWTRNNSVVEALNTAFATALKHNVQTTNKRYLLAVNVNQRFMSCWVHGTRVLSPVITAAGLAQILAHTESRPTLTFFDTEVRMLSLTNTMQMPEICQDIVKQVSLGEDNKCTCDVSAPVIWAEKQKKAYDVIIIMTDFRHPKALTDLPSAFRQYRHALNLPNAKLVVCGLTASHFQLASSEDPRMLDIAGFDVTVPSVIHSFVMDRL